MRPRESGRIFVSKNGENFADSLRSRVKTF